MDVMPWLPPVTKQADAFVRLGEAVAILRRVTGCCWRLLTYQRPPRNLLPGPCCCCPAPLHQITDLMIKYTQGQPLVDPERNDLSSMNNAAISVLLASEATKQQQPRGGGLSFSWRLCAWAGGKFWGSGGGRRMLRLAAFGRLLAGRGG